MAAGSLVAEAAAGLADVASAAALASGATGAAVGDDSVEGAGLGAVLQPRAVARVRLRKRKEGAWWGQCTAWGLELGGKIVLESGGYSRDHDRRIGAGTFTTKLGEGKVLYQRVPELHPVLQRRFLANALRWLVK